jgi:cysteine desulfurase family protein
MIYLDNAATTFPKPEAVTEAVYNFMQRKAANPGRSGHKLSMAAAEEVYLCREAATELFGAQGPECVAFTLNATHSINMALKGVLLHRAGAHVITSDLEHNAVMRPLYKLRDAGISYSMARVDLVSDDATVEAFERQITDKTVMIACTHASNVCGRLLPIKRLGALCRERGLLFLVDASQTAGVVPIDMQECNIDYLCMPGHKSLYGPMGTGMLITSSGETLETLIEGGTGSNSVSFEQPDFMPDRMESGTVNAPGIAGLRAGIAYVTRMGLYNIYNREMGQTLALYDMLAEIKGVRLCTPRPSNGYVPIVSFNIDNMTSTEAASWLDTHGFALRGGLHCSPVAHTRLGTLSLGLARASFGAFNTKKDAVRLADAAAQAAAVKK